MKVYLEYMGMIADIEKPDNNYGDNEPIFREMIKQALDILGVDEP